MNGDDADAESNSNRKPRRAGDELGGPEKDRSERLDTNGRGEISDEILRRGAIEQSSTAQVMVAVAFLICVTLISFVAVAIISNFFVPTQANYWMIELVFALLCGGAGALIGGSAVVRSTLGIPGNPVNSTLGGAAAMVIVGFWLAWLAKPTSEPPTYSLEINDIPVRTKVEGTEYQIYVGTDPEEMSPLIIRDRSNVILRIPSTGGTYHAIITIFKPDANRPTIYARCKLSFETLDSQLGIIGQSQVVPMASDSHFHFYLAPDYVARVVKGAKANTVIENKPCLETVINIASESKRRIVSNRFVIAKSNYLDIISDIARLRAPLAYSIKGIDRANNDPEDTQPDLPPQATADGAGVAVPKREAVPNPVRQVPASRDAVAERQPTEDRSVASSQEAQIKHKLDAYVRGEDFDRTDLYENWSQVKNDATRGFRESFVEGSPRAARYLNLIANALNTIDDGEYLPPSRRPNWSKDTKPVRLSKSNNIPGFQDEDYQNVVMSLCSNNNDVRSAAQRLLKLYPSNHFYSYIQALSQSATGRQACNINFVSESAIYYFYNRIVEYDGTFSLDDQSRKWVEGNYVNGMDWVRRATSIEPSRSIFSAMLDYAYGIVFWDHGDRNVALRKLSQMMDKVRSSSAAYPSNPEHLAKALKLLNDPEQKSESAQSVRPYGRGEERSIDAGYVRDDAGTTIRLFAIPERSKNDIGKISPENVARMLLSAVGWDLIQVGGQIGWAQKTDVGARN